MNDLFVICPDLDWQSVLEEILKRPQSLGTRPFTSTPRKFAGQGDGGVRAKAPELVRATAARADRFFRAHQVTPSSAVYRKVANKASLDRDRCSCRSFHRFVDILREWFPPA